MAVPGWRNCPVVVPCIVFADVPLFVGDSCDPGFIVRNSPRWSVEKLESQCRGGLLVCHPCRCGLV